MIGASVNSDKKNDLVTWNDSLSLGLDEVDHQHRFLVERINRLWHALLEQHEQESVQDLLEDLYRYTRTHFSAEEALMRAFDYPKLDQHQKSHRAFEARISEATDAYAHGQPVSMDLLHFLNDWLQNHIKVTDRDYAKHVDRKKHGGLLSGFSGMFRFFNALTSDAPPTTEQHGLQGLDLQQAIAVHQKWVKDLEAYVAGQPVEMSALEAAQDDRCLLGNWLLAHAEGEMQKLNAFETLREDHSRFHLCAANIIAHYQEQAADEARLLLRQELRHLSNTVRLDIIQLYAAFHRETAP